jgi:GR25 family glycosyltransferase involved in LPS biosynthesis
MPTNQSQNQTTVEELSQQIHSMYSLPERQELPGAVKELLVFFEAIIRAEERKNILTEVQILQEDAGHTCKMTEGEYGCDDAHFYQEMGIELEKIFKLSQPER